MRHLIMASNTFLYFAYGSNLLRERLVLANPSAVFKTVGKLKDYELVFCGETKRWRGGVASIEQRQDKEVWGVVWQLDNTHLTSLDQQESTYTPMEVTVTDAEGGTYYSRTYQQRNGWPLAPPSPHYKDVIVRGAHQSKLPQQYLSLLDSVQDNCYQGDVPVYNDVMKLLPKEKQSLL